jgi:predicted nucleic acid-binding protein
MQALDEYTVLPVTTSDVVDRWVELRAATIPQASPDDRERRQNDTWIAACALSVSPPLPIVTANLRDFQVLAAVSALTLIHPDLAAS